MNSIIERLAALGHTLPPPKSPAGNYVSRARHGGLLLVAGQIGRPGIATTAGLAGAGLSIEDACHEARFAALGLLAQLDDAVAQDPGRIVQVLRLGVFVAAAPTFDQHGVVANAASDLLVAVLGDAGRHARTAVGVASLPAGAVVEVDAMVLLRDDAA
jgi:enamine deaminase RidA (YjgF/YER057c/UK114 family)